VQTVGKRVLKSLIKSPFLSEQVLLALEFQGPERKMWFERE
jgi:hypothetical protein